MTSSGIAAFLALLGCAEALRLEARSNSTAVYSTCSDVPGATDGYYMLKPPSSGISVVSNEDVEVPSAGVSVYCRFEGGHAWALMGTFKDGQNFAAWATSGNWDYSTSSRPAPDDTTSGVTARFPLKLWNDMAQALPNGAITHTSSVYSTESNGQYDICPGFWKTSCQLYSAHQAHTQECAEPWKEYSADGTFTDQQYDYNSGGFSDGHGAIVGYGSTGTKSGTWTGGLILTGFQSGHPALGKCHAGTNTYISYTHSRGFMFWIGGPYTGVGAAAVGDPHLQNIHGERFDLMQTGTHVLINIPRGTNAKDALLRVQADARRVGGVCADIYFQELNVTGSWAEAEQAGGHHYSVSQRGVETPGWVAFGSIKLKVVRGHTDAGLLYLNLYVKHLGRAGFPVGGLLGEDDHGDASTPPDSCHQRLALKKGYRSPVVGSVAVAGLE